MPEVGDMAPDFELPSHEARDKRVRLSDFQGKKNVVIAFHPLSFTPVCATQMPNYEKDLSRLAEHDVQVLSISVDAQPTRAAWAESIGGVSYPMLSDFEPKGAVARLFGVYREENGFSERATFIVDKTGKIVYKQVHQISDVPQNEEIFNALGKLQ